MGEKKGEQKNEKHPVEISFLLSLSLVLQNISYRRTLQEHQRIFFLPLSLHTCYIKQNYNY